MASSLQQGINAAKGGQMQKALGFLKDAIIEEPQNADVWVWIAAIIDDLDKQEIFLEKALEIDPNNIPAQRGLAYLQKRKQEKEIARNEHLSDHTQPISPFPPSQRPKMDIGGWSRLSQEDMNDIAHPQYKKPEVVEKKERSKEKHTSQKLSLFEFTLLGIVVVVFCFIGLLAASAIFDFELPLGFLWGNKPRLTTEPPYRGVFLYENGVYFDVQEYQGLPTSDKGMPISFSTKPVIVFWQTGADLEDTNLIFQNGSYIPFDTYTEKTDSNLLQPSQEIEPGLYCLQHLGSVANEDSLYWCFKVEILSPIE